MLAKDKVVNMRVKVIRKMIKARLTSQYSTGFANLVKWFTKFDSEDRCMPQDALSLDYLKQAKVKYSMFDLDDMQAVSVDIVQKDEQETGLSESNLYLEKLMNSLSTMYENGEKWYELDGAIDRSPQELSLPFGNARKARQVKYTVESEPIAELSQELGCPPQSLWVKLRSLQN